MYFIIQYTTYLRKYLRICFITSIPDFKNDILALKDSHRIEREVIYKKSI